MLEELTEFLHRDDVSRASSCRSVLVDGEKTAVMNCVYDELCT